MVQRRRREVQLVLKVEYPIGQFSVDGLSPIGHALCGAPEPEHHCCSSAQG